VGPPTTLKGLSRFLVEHEPCGAGFDVSHPAGLGSGRVSMTCRGCGATYEYATTTIEFEREVEFEPVTIAVPVKEEPEQPTQPMFVTQPVPAAIEAPTPKEDEEGPAKEPETMPEEPAEGEKKPAGEKKRRSSAMTRERVVTAALLILSAAALAFAVIRVTGDDGESTTETPPSPAPAATAPAKPKPAQPAPAAKAKPRQPQTPASKPQASTPQATKPTANERLVETNRFSVIVPKDWAQRPASGGGTLLAPPGSAPVSLQVFYENDPGLSAARMSGQTARFLRSRDPETTISSTKRLRVSGNPAFELRADGPAGSQAALGVLDGSYRYLVILSEDPGTSKSLADEANRALKSFRPR